MNMAEEKKIHLQFLIKFIKFLDSQEKNKHVLFLTACMLKKIVVSRGYFKV